MKVLENYFFMTALQIISSLFGILIYPYIIRVIGAESYGLYVFALSVASYFIGFISFGFTFPAVKGIIENKDKLQEKNNIISSVILAKTYLSIISTLVFTTLLFTIPILKQNKAIFLICYSQIIAEIFFPAWYFQAVQKMRIVTYIQLGFRVLSLPFIFLLIKNPADCWIYALVSSSTVVLSSISSIIYLYRTDHIRLHLVSINSLKTYFQDALPFFWSSTFGVIKQESVTTIIGSYFGMRDVALYDLANKLITVPRMLTMSINSALFPKIIDNVPLSTIRKIINYEAIIGLGIVGMVVMFGQWVIMLLGGAKMLDSYPIAIVLSGTVLAWLVVGCYNNFIFVPMKKYYFVFHVQVVALISFLVFCLGSLFIFKNIFVIAAA